jgi:molecular chaperone GrpE
MERKKAKAAPAERAAPAEKKRAKAAYESEAPEGSVGDAPAPEELAGDASASDGSAGAGVAGEVSAGNGAARTGEEEPAGPEEPSGPKVVDRRRLKIDEEGQTGPEGVEEDFVRKPTFVEELEYKVAAAEQKLREHIDRLDKESTEFRARQERELERRARQAKKEAASAFLGIADDMGRATAAAAESLEDSSRSREALESLVQGMGMIQGRFFSELASLGVQPFASMGEKFDPERHEAVRTVEVADPALDGVVVEELAPGYLLGDEVIRPSPVAVGKIASS